VKLFFVVPALDERANLPELSTRLRAAAEACGRPAEVILVDDGSSDGTGEAAPAAFAPLPVRVLRHATNLGVGPAFRTGFSAALATAADDDLVVTLEADNTSDIGRLPDLVRLADGGADLVLGSCYAPGGGVVGTDFRRRVVSGCANLLVKAWFGLWRLHTFSSFYRVHRVPALREAFAASGGDPLSEGGFSSVVDRRQGKSKMRVGRTIRGYFRVMVLLGPFACRVR
jgi:dolichol-phosphate mannosyltransferase